ncbi:MAG TPA: molecular chaperone TorD family protein [Holophagaceae bacterium]|nr:molecular chaperone TorD family protein [Holophagaceae bacterium]
MAPTFALMPALADLLAYPDESLKPKAVAVAESVKWYAETWEDLLEAFALHLQLTPLRELEETYTSVFDMNPSASLEIGWHLFGETYKRGVFLANLKETHRTYGVPEGTDLPDHLATLLRLLGRLPQEEAESLTRDCLLPALAKLRPKVAGAAPYDTLLEAIDLLLRGLVPQEQTGEQADGAPKHEGCNCGSGHGHTHQDPSSQGGFRGPEVNHAR